jgi:biotin carboxyl carrier protein
MENAPTAAPVAAPAAAPAAAAAPAPAPAAPAAAPAGAGTDINSPLPGVIIEVSVKEGQAIKAGQKVAVLEAMKMENDILAEKDGTVTAIHVHKGDSVLEGAKIVTIA